MPRQYPGSVPLRRGVSIGRDCRGGGTGKDAAMQHPASGVAVPAPLRTRSVWSGILVGLGVAAFVDEVVFHQLLHWHHFYDGGGPDLALVSDGLFHTGGWLAVVAGLFLFADLQRRRGLAVAGWRAGLLIGLGGFQLYDGLVQHKLLRLHEIRYGVELTPYDLTWNALAVVALAAGLVLLRRS
jgi:uncharacterized membrane protein